MPIYSALCSRALLNRLKIPWEKSRAGSTPVSSTLYNQRLTSKVPQNEDMSREYHSIPEELDKSYYESNGYLEV